MLNASCGGALISKSYEEGYKLIESITTNTYHWPITPTIVVSIQKKPLGVHEVIETTTLIAQMAQIHQMMTSPDVPTTKPIKVVTGASEVACIY